MAPNLKTHTHKEWNMKTIPRYENRGNWHRGIWTRILSTQNAKNTLTVQPLHLCHPHKKEDYKNEKNHPVSTTRVTGFEPVNNGTKIRCLSIWRYPYTRVAQIWSKIWLCHRSGAQFLAICHKTAIKRGAWNRTRCPIICKTVSPLLPKSDCQTRMSDMYRLFPHGPSPQHSR